MSNERQPDFLENDSPSVLGARDLLVPPPALLKISAKEVVDSLHLIQRSPRSRIIDLELQSLALKTQDERKLKEMALLESKMKFQKIDEARQRHFDEVIGKDKKSFSLDKVKVAVVPPPTFVKKERANETSATNESKHLLLSRKGKGRSTGGPNLRVLVKIEAMREILREFPVAVPHEPHSRARSSHASSRNHNRKKYISTTQRAANSAPSSPTAAANRGAKFEENNEEDSRNAAAGTPFASSLLHRAEEVRKGLRNVLGHYYACTFIEKVVHAARMEKITSRVLGSDANMRIVLGMQRVARRARAASKQRKEIRAREIINRSVTRFVMRFVYRQRRVRADLILNFLHLLATQIPFRFIIRDYRRKIIFAQRVVRSFIACRRARLDLLMRKLELGISTTAASEGKSKNGFIALQTYASFLLEDYLRILFFNHVTVVQEYKRAAKSSDHTPSFREVSIWDVKSFLKSSFSGNNTSSTQIPQFITRVVGREPIFILFSRPFLQEELLVLVEKANDVEVPVVKKVEKKKKLRVKKKEEPPLPQFDRKADQMDASIALHKAVTIYLRQQKDQTNTRR